MSMCKVSGGSRKSTRKEHTYVSLATNEEHRHTHFKTSLSPGITVAPLRAVAIEPPAVAPPATTAKPDWEAEFRRKQ